MHQTADGMDAIWLCGYIYIYVGIDIGVYREGYMAIDPYGIFTTTKVSEELPKSWNRGM